MWQWKISQVGSFECMFQHRAETHGLWAVGMSHDNLLTVLPSADTLSDTALTPLARKVLRDVQTVQTVKTSMNGGSLKLDENKNNKVDPQVIGFSRLSHGP